MTDESLINQYYTKLLESKTPHLVLGQIFKQIFSRDLQSREWAQLGKLTRIYGKWLVLEAFIRAGINQGFNSESPWGYFNSICLSISKEDRDSLEYLEKIRVVQQETAKLIEELEKPRRRLKLRESTFLSSDGISRPESIEPKRRGRPPKRKEENDRIE